MAAKVTSVLGDEMRDPVGGIGEALRRDAAVDDGGDESRRGLRGRRTGDEQEVHTCGEGGDRRLADAPTTEDRNRIEIVAHERATEAEPLAYPSHNGLAARVGLRRVDGLDHGRPEHQPANPGCDHGCEGHLVDVGKLPRDVRKIAGDTAGSSTTTAWPG